MPLILSEVEIEAIKSSLKISYYHSATDLLEILNENPDSTKWVVMSPEEYEIYTKAK